MQEDTYTGDPNDPLSLNLYTYCSNNPVMYIDPTGHWQQGDEKLNSEDKAKIVALTNAYYAAATATEKTAIQSQAFTIRTNATKAMQANYNAYENKATPIKIETGSAVTNIVNQAVASRGYMTQSEWNQVCNTVGVTSTVTTKDIPATSVKNTNVVTSFGRTDIGVNTSMNYSSITASSSMSLTYNLTANEALFIKQQRANSKEDDTIEQSISLLDVLENNGGEISRSQVEEIESRKESDDATTMLNLFYQSSMNNTMIAQLDYLMAKERLDQAFAVVALSSACLTSNVNLNIYGGAEDISVSGYGYTVAEGSQSVEGTLSTKIPSTLTQEEIDAANAVDLRMQAQRGIAGKGWRGDSTWRANVSEVGSGGTIKSINGTIPTEQEAIDLINTSGGKVLRIEEPHAAPNPHNFPHINYETPSGGKGTIQIK
jgi:hypothetical protein